MFVAISPLLILFPSEMFCTGFFRSTSNTEGVPYGYQGGSYEGSVQIVLYKIFISVFFIL